MEAGIHFGETRCRNYTLHSMAGGRIGDATELPISMKSWFSWFYRIKTSTRIETTNKKLPVGAEHVLDLHAMFDACRIDLQKRKQRNQSVRGSNRHDVDDMQSRGRWLPRRQAHDVLKAAI